MVLDLILLLLSQCRKFIRFLVSDLNTSLTGAGFERGLIYKFSLLSPFTSTSRPEGRDIRHMGMSHILLILHRISG